MATVDHGSPSQFVGSPGRHGPTKWSVPTIKVSIDLSTFFEDHSRRHSSFPWSENLVVSGDYTACLIAGFSYSLCTDAPSGRGDEETDGSLEVQDEDADREQDTEQVMKLRLKGILCLKRPLSWHVCEWLLRNFHP